MLRLQAKGKTGALNKGHKRPAKRQKTVRQALGDKETKDADEKLLEDLVIGNDELVTETFEKRIVKKVRVTYLLCVIRLITSYHVYIRV